MKFGQRAASCDCESGRDGLVLKKEEDWIDGCCVIIVKLPLQQSVKITLPRVFTNTHSHGS